MALKLTEADLSNPDRLAEKLKTLSEIIVRKHFYASVNEREDLISIGILKALTLISEGKFSSERGNFATFLYTGMRNDMHNYLYHQNKFNVVDIEEADKEGEDDLYFDQEVVYIDYSLIHSVCMRFSRTFGDSIEGFVIEGLLDSGFEIRGMRETNSHASLSFSDILADRYGENVRDDMVGRIIGVILWKRKEHDCR